MSYPRLACRLAASSRTRSLPNHALPAKHSKPKNWAIRQSCGAWDSMASAEEVAGGPQLGSARFGKHENRASAIWRR